MDSPIDELNSVKGINMEPYDDNLDSPNFDKASENFSANNHNYFAPHSANVRSHFI